MQAVVDLNDIRLYVDNGTQHLLSPGFALLQKDKDPVLGEIAMHQSRLSPARTANRFWRDISLNPVGISHPQVRHQADLVWHHLRELNSEIALDRGIFLCPGHYGDEQLSLLSGVLKTQDITPAALINRTLAAALCQPEADLFIEFQLHQILVSRIEREEGEIFPREPRALGDGQLGILDSLLKAIQKRFIRETRFDPLHHAQTEQQLVDALPGILDHLQRGETTLALVQSAKEEYRAEVHRDDLARALEPLWQELNQWVPAGSVVLADSEMSLLPGVDQLNGEVDFISAEQLLASARQIALPEVEGDEPLYLSRSSYVPGATNKPKAAQAAQPTPEPQPRPAWPPLSASGDSLATHLLSQGVAYRSQKFWLGVSERGRLSIFLDQPAEVLATCELTDRGLQLESSKGVEVNGELLAGNKILHPSDHVSAVDYPGGATAIRVTGDAA